MSIVVEPPVYMNILGALRKKVINIALGIISDEYKEKAENIINSLFKRTEELYRERAERELYLYPEGDAVRFTIAAKGTRRITRREKYKNLEGRQIEVFKPEPAHLGYVSPRSMKCSCEFATLTSARAFHFIRDRYPEVYRSIKPEDIAQYTLCKHTLYIYSLLTLSDNLRDAMPTEETLRRAVAVLLLGHGIPVRNLSMILGVRRWRRH